MSTSDDWPKLEIYNVGPHGRDTQVLLDGRDVSHWVSELSLHMGVQHVNEAQLRIYLREVVVDEHAALQIAAHLPHEKLMSLVVNRDDEHDDRG